jgi:hypothetical protein
MAVSCKTKCMHVLACLIGIMRKCHQKDLIWLYKIYVLIYEAMRGFSYNRISLRLNI